MRESTHEEDKSLREDVLDESAVIRHEASFRQKITGDPIFRFFAARKKTIVTAIILTVILIGAVAARMNTFWLPHWMGDQCHYLSLAMKLERFGLEHYTLRGVDVDFINVDPEGKVRLVFPKPSRNIRKKGEMLRGMELAGITYYDIPFFHKPPARSRGPPPRSGG